MKYGSIAINISLFLFVHVGNKAWAQQPVVDHFAQIGNRVAAVRSDLLEERPPVTHPEKYLHGDNKKEAAFTPMHKMADKKELYDSLTVMRKRYAPFMQNLAPAISATRKRIPLDTFQWREETPADRADFQGVTKGTGAWKQVSIPHYGPPVGRAVTYYRRCFTITPDMLTGKSIFTCFKGVDYKAQVYVNGYLAGTHEGFFAPFEFECSRYLHAGENTLLVKVENDYSSMGMADDKGVYGDKLYAAGGPGWNEPEQGWHLCLPGMGIYQDCFVEIRDQLHIKDVFVMPLPDKQKAEVWLELNNYHDTYQDVVCQLSLYGQNFRAVVFEKVNRIPETTHVPGYGDMAKTSDWQKSRLKMGYGSNFYKTTIDIPDPRLWDPVTPWLYQLQVKLLDKNEQVTDVRKQTFGMRSFTMDTVNIPKGRMYLNGQMIRLRGANDMGFMQGDVMRKNWNQLTDDILLAKLCNMNFIRLTQRPEQDEVYEYCDMLGMMTQTDLPLFGGLRRNQWAEAVRQAQEMETLVRNHPANILVTYINERFVNAEGYPQRNMATQEDYYGLFAACNQAVLMMNPLRVIKPGDGDYDPPSPGLPDNHCYNAWYNGHGLGLGMLHKGWWMPVKSGWYYGCGEFGAEGLDPEETMYKYYPKGWLPKSSANENTWTPGYIAQAQTYKFHYMWFNTQYRVKDWVAASQQHQAWATRLVAEAFRRDARMVSFAIHLFIDAWPAGWMKTIMDVDRQPKPAYFAYRNALAPLMISLRTDRYTYFTGEDMKMEAWISNDGNDSLSGYQLRYQLEQNGKIKWASENVAVIPVNSAAFQGYIRIPAPTVKERVQYQLRIGLFNAAGKAASESVIDVNVFPSMDKKSIPQIQLLTKTDGPARKLVNEMNIAANVSEDAGALILIDDYEKYISNKSVIDNRVKAGATALFIELQPGKYVVGETNIAVIPTMMGQHFFVSPAKTLLQKGVQPLDFKFLYNRNTDYATPILASFFTAPGWQPLLTSGNPDWTPEKGIAFAAGEQTYGKGKFRICQLLLEGKIMVNPPLQKLVSEMITVVKE
jgi:hypothetical protein